MTDSTDTDNSPNRDCDKLVRKPLDAKARRRLDKLTPSEQIDTIIIDHLTEDAARSLLDSSDPARHLHRSWSGLWTILADAFDALPDADARWQTVYNALEARNLVDDTIRHELIATADRASNILENVYWLTRDENQDLPDLTDKIRRQRDEAEASYR